MALSLPLVLDTTVLSNFSHARRPDVVRHLSRVRALVPLTVMTELQTGVAYHGVPECNWSWLTVGSLADGMSFEDILRVYPPLTEVDIRAALARFEALNHRAGLEAEAEGVDEAALEAEIEAIKREVFEERYSQD